jgi:hypothetical protein
MLAMVLPVLGLVVAVSRGLSPWLGVLLFLPAMAAGGLVILFVEVLVAFFYVGGTDEGRRIRKLALSLEDESEEE